MWDLKDAVRVMGRAQLGLELTEDEVGAIVEFLKSLTGEQPRIAHPILPPVTGDTPLPKPFTEVMQTIEETEPEAPTAR